MKYKLLIVSLIVLNTFAFAQAYAISENEAFFIALRDFNNTVPVQYRQEFRVGPGGLNRIDSSIYSVSWSRFVNEIPIIGDQFLLDINRNTGEIINKRYVFSAPAEQLKTIPSITKDQAKWILQQKQWILQGEPQLQIRNKELIWFIRLSNNCEAAISAKTGETDILGCPLGEALSNPSVRFNPTQFYIEFYGPYILFLTIIIVGGVLYLYKHPFASKRK